MLRGLIFAFCLVAGVGTGVALATEQKDSDLQICAERLVAGVGELTCLCPSEATASGSVWGSDPYTDDSAICRSALHAGAIGNNGGVVQVVEAPGQADYPALTRNSVASGQWGNWTRSIAFRALGEVPDADRLPVITVAACPANAVGLAVGARLSCACLAEAAGAGAVWGSGPYTGDSSICRAALHAGAFDGEVGIVHVRVLPGRDSYPASRRNGVDAGSWGSYGSSFEVSD